MTTEQETILDQLVIPRGHKDILLSLLAQHFRDKESVAAMTEQADIVRGKGKGLIILLHGGPGVGKTATAEVLAECFQRPLFTITSGDLGTTVSEVEVALETHFALATRWGCILLLDEADVFLAPRTPQDFERNGLLSVFLRVLDDYAGILVITTNQMGDFDEAFASRIHIVLYYPPLDLCATQKVLKLNLRLIHDHFTKKQLKIDIEEEQILEFAEQAYCEHLNARWNGRQIRNACQTALALAEFDAQCSSHENVPTPNARVVLTLKNFETVFNAHLEFISFLEALHGVNSGRRAK